MKKKTNKKVSIWLFIMCHSLTNHKRILPSACPVAMQSSFGWQATQVNVFRAPFFLSSLRKNLMPDQGKEITAQTISTICHRGLYESLMIARSATWRPHRWTFCFLKKKTSSCNDLADAINSPCVNIWTKCNTDFYSKSFSTLVLN